MQRDVLESQWPQIKDAVRARFNELTEEDIRQINGRYDVLVSKLQQRYNYSKEEAEEKIRNWNVDRATLSKDERYRREEAGKTDQNAALKWALALGIPLLLLGAYLLSQPRETVTREAESARAPARTTTERVVVETPADRTISNGLRETFARQGLPQAGQNIQITTNNGVVTLSGVVPDRETRDLVESTATQFSGVRRVINNLQVR